MRSFLGVLAAASLAAALGACGARTGSMLDDYEEEPRDLADGGSDGGGEGTGPCVLCDTDSDCGFCLVQGQERSYRCTLGATAPEFNCMHLLEQYTGEDGIPYTCFYCGDP